MARKHEPLDPCSKHTAVSQRTVQIVYALHYERSFVLSVVTGFIPQLSQTLHSAWYLSRDSQAIPFLSLTQIRNIEFYCCGVQLFIERNFLNISFLHLYLLRHFLVTLHNTAQRILSVPVLQ
jgi:hypothetical protein